ncbi:[FeFe] hydrogenase H-cluster maturation GTPase HydF [Fusobacterium mortiferum]|jgi:[FeFe] hydrogenase H-cluster maturation GTPase HydF|uniref:[FeFe] hydrogenase H-cluster maturation GTPase HydF n=1 Tax=Fusobacterium mortiferum ATCC 9817 TaxID=469616 RepID=A0ABM6TT60_FUSMR|nr:[FeFe] hydrogenase H-cluster maturation GTPase HydF [Fusobacterium mortiferum]AVQ17644.1 [FeFe] hydrogenase H-cluster maturation GTPase HydF [Fusobacterium mortiferum ATCC 9817]EEO35486.1 hydrogenase maturation GTPase HydF [Fusobacterium mortiferum ATCC 9817]MDY4800815.1 [FeFe] hydrogenase H-cluster maturation GTPase HydF [Fusobacterium mortiferum]
MIETPRGNRVHIAIYGRTNAGKSSLINKITNQSISLVSETRGTTTDPVYKAMELLPIGPVVFIDTAGIDDTTELGELRVKKTKEILNKMDIALLLISTEVVLENQELNYEKEWIREIKKREKPFIVILNKVDLVSVEKLQEIEEKVKRELGCEISKVTTSREESIQTIKNKIIEYAPKIVVEEKLIGDKIKIGDKILLVAPQDIQAPKGRLILPQVQVIRDILDNGGIPTVVTLDNLKEGLAIFQWKPDLVITDSQVFKTVDEILDKEVPLTSFSIIMARAKGDLETLYRGAKRINSLKEGDRVLIAEACTHHQLKGDIAREKLPMLLQKKAGRLEIDNCSGKDFPEDISKYSLVIHCGSCMLNRAETISRLGECSNKEIPITNFGMAIAEINGILDRVMEIFKEG